MLMDGQYGQISFVVSARSALPPMLLLWSALTLLLLLLPRLDQSIAMLSSQSH